MSSKVGLSDASHCIDNVIDCNGTTTCDNYLCHTLNNGIQWLQINATSEHPDIDEVIVYNRIDDYQNRINGAILSVSHDPTFNTVDWQASFGYSAALVYNFSKSQTGI